MIRMEERLFGLRLLQKEKRQLSLKSRYLPLLKGKRKLRKRLISLVPQKLLLLSLPFLLYYFLFHL